MDSFADEFREAYMARWALNKRKLEIVEKAEKLHNEQKLLETLLEERSPNKLMSPVLLGSAFNRVYVTNIGTFPPYKCEGGYFFPIGFESKRRHRRYRECVKNKKERLQYVCTVKEDGLSIAAEDGYKWEGENCWEQFSASTDANGEFSGFAEFSGLTDGKIIQLIESNNDTSTYSDYVPYKERQNNKQ
ncbi:hypothetical protein PAEPH01_1980 [Pancytospora epiphaga]|nr:hypothetical protein PAEPH01_1980 [Pancytospora epiphaga]